MVNREQFIKTLNEKGDISYVLHDYVCVEHNHTSDELQFLIAQLNNFGITQWFIENMLDWYKRALTVCSVQKPNPNYNEHAQTLMGFNLQPQFITLYYF